MALTSISGLLGTPLYYSLKLGGRCPPNAQVGGAAAPPVEPPLCMHAQRRFDRKLGAIIMIKFACEISVGMLLECVMTAKMAKASPFNLPFLEFAAVFCSV